MKTPYETVKELFFDNLQRVRENDKYNFANSERFMIWIVGFAIGGMSLIVSNVTELDSQFSRGTIKLILVLLSLSIIFGIIYRYAFYGFQIYYQSFEFFLEGAFSSKNILSHDAENIDENVPVNEIVSLFKIDFDIDMSYEQRRYEEASDKDKRTIHYSLVKYYNEYNDFIKKQYEIAFDYVKNIYIEHFHFSKKQIDRLFSSYGSRYMRIYRRIAIFSFIISCLSFIMVVVILCVFY